MSYSMLVFFIINAIELSDVGKHFGSIIIKGNKTVFSYGNEKKKSFTNLLFGVEFD